MIYDNQSILEQTRAAVIAGNHEKAAALTQQALANGVDPREFLDHGLIGGMNVVGTRFRNGDIFLPEVLIAARAMKAGMALLRPELSKTDVEPIGKVVIGTVEGDLHDIGKNIVIYMLQGAGFTIVDLGINVPAATFASAVKQHKPDFVGISALLTTTMLAMKGVIESLKESQLREQVKIIVGGAPVSQRFADEIGADAYAVDAGAGVDICKQMSGRS